MSNTSMRREEKRDICNRKRFYTCRSLFGYNDVFFYLIVGGRDTGKSYTVMDRFIRDFKTKGIPFYWLRLTDKIASAMLQNNASKMIDADLVRKYGLELTVKGNEVFDHGVKMAEVMGISNFYNMKGTATFDCEWKKGYNICLDECQREVGEAVRFDLSYALVNALENYVRDTKERLRIVFICNYTETVSDIMNLFNFIPEKWGRYHLAKKKAVVDFLPPTEQYKARRDGSVADILMPNASTFSNKKIFNKELISKSRLIKPIMKMEFGDEAYTVWLSEDGNRVVKSWNKEKVRVVAMTPYMDGLLYDANLVKNIYSTFDACGFKYKDLITQQRFTLALAKLKKRK